MISVGVIGYGYWGPNLARNFAEAGECTLAAVCDSNPDRLAHARKRYPSVRATADWRDLLADPAVDAVAIATPVSTHYPIALEALRSGRPALVEKPLAASSGEVVRLMEEAARRRLVLMVDHTFVYHGAVRKIRELVAAGELGDIYYYDSVRVNLGVFQPDVDVLWDLAIHDLAIMDRVLPARPSAITATGANHLPGVPENIAYLTLFFEDSALIAHINVNWLSPVKIRRTLIGGSRRMIVYDDMEPSEKVKVYDRGITVASGPDSVYSLRVGYRAGDMSAPQLDVAEALHNVVEHFAACIESAREPVTGGAAALRVVEVLEAAGRSMRARGRLVELPASAARPPGV